MNNSITLHIGRFIILILTQVFVLNHINFLGYLNPYIYTLFILLLPINMNRSLFLFLSFLIGLTVDIFGDSGGIHAAASTILAFSRPVILRFVFGLSYEFQTIKLNTAGFGEKLAYVALSTLLHHLFLFTLEFFNFSHILLILKKTLFTSLFSIFVIMLILMLFRRKET